jgi:3-mercaptopyruvate sulfurtransferase SseA
MMAVRRGFSFAALLVLTIILSLTGCATTETGSGSSVSSPRAANGYPNGDLLVSTSRLQENLGSKEIVIIDARTSGYEASHIPGAVNLVWDQFKTEGKLRSVKDLEARLTAAGLRRDMKFIIYDDPSQSFGTAGWFFWLLEYLGCTDVHVLDGGWSKWIAGGGATETGIVRRPGSGTFTAALNELVTVRASHITAKSGSKGFAVIDARAPEEFNGWQLYGEPRGGHIPGAVNIDYRSFYGRDKTLLEHKDIKSLLESRGITPDKQIASYCLDGIRSGNVYFALRLMGYEHCSSYDGSVREWSREPSLPMEKLARYEKLVYPAWVKDLTEGRNPPGYEGKKHVLLEVRYTGASFSQLVAFKGENGYIPGAISIHPCYVEHEDNYSKYYPDYTGPQDAKLLPPHRLLKVLARLGITKDTMVVVYGNGKIIPMITARVAWALMYAGVRDVRVLNGGFTTWAAAGYPVVSTPVAPQPARSFGAELPAHPEYYATPDYVRSIADGRNGGSVLVDVRKISEYEGRSNPYPFFTRKGRIPGAVWQGDWDVLVNIGDDTFRSYPEVQKLWKGLGVTPDREPVFYCGTGWRSTIGFLQAYLMGFPKMRNYDASFYDWSSNPDNPIIEGKSK